MDERGGLEVVRVLDRHSAGRGLPPCRDYTEVVDQIRSCGRTRKMRVVIRADASQLRLLGLRVSRRHSVRLEGTRVRVVCPYPDVDPDRVVVEFRGRAESGLERVDSACSFLVVPEGFGEAEAETYLVLRRGEPPLLAEQAEAAVRGVFRDTASRG